jgi:hypothetical protein
VALDGMGAANKAWPARLAELIHLMPISELTRRYQAMTGNPEKGAG